jgi:hypothetical protein
LLLKNLARAYELYGQKRQAVVALETFLVREPNSGDKEQIQRRIEVLKKQIAAEKPVPVAAVPPPAAAAAATTPAAPEPDQARGKRSIVPLIVAGAGGVILIAGSAMYSKGAKDVTHYEELCPDHDCGTGDDATANAEAANDARSRKTAGGVVAGVGAATLAGGLVWYFMQPRQPVKTGSLQKPMVTPALTPSYAGIALSGAF